MTQLLQKYKWQIIVLLLLVIILSAFLITQKSPSQTPPSPADIPFPSVSLPEKTVTILETSPKNDEKDVYPGEIEIFFITNKPILSSDEFSVDFSPKLPFYYKITNTFPANKITLKIFGGLDIKTTYTVTITKSNKEPVYIWSFTTSEKKAESSSGLVFDKEQDLLKNYYPLSQFTPYSTSDFRIEYTYDLTLKVSVKGSSIEKVKQEVLNWIKSHGVDPNTHVIHYSNVF